MIGFYCLIVNMNIVPVVGDPSTAPIDNCLYCDPTDKVSPPAIGGSKYSAINFESTGPGTGWALLQAFLTANNLLLDEKANYYQTLETDH